MRVKIPLLAAEWRVVVVTLQITTVLLRVDLTFPTPTTIGMH